jgi:Reverse transcriptase (RNA-dependent DNA polymerase)
MQDAETVLGVLRERGRRGLPCEELYRQMFNIQLYLMAYGRIYSNQGAMTPGATQETADGMSVEKIRVIIAAMRRERYRFAPARRVLIPKKNGKMRPLGMPTWSDKLVGEVVRLLLEAYYEPQFSDYSHGFRPGRGCHTALREIAETWTGTTWFIEGDISDCLDPWSYCSFADLRVQKSPSWWAGISIRRPFLRPVRVRTARSSPRLTFCNTVCRETPSARLAWCRASHPSGASLVSMPRS